MFETTVAPAPGAHPDGHAASFDQARHAGAGSRPGSWLAVAFTVPPVGLGRIGDAWRKVIDRHGTLRTVLQEDAATRTSPPGSPRSVRVHDIVVTGGQWRRIGDAGQDPRRVLRELFDAACDPFGVPSHRLTVTTHADGTRTAVIGLDHSHGDAWSLLVLVRDMLAFLGVGEHEGVDLVDGAVPELRESVPSFADHTRDLERRPTAPVEVRNRWARIMADGGGQMPRFPRPLGEVSTPRDEVVEVIDVLDADGVEALERVAAKAGVRLLPLAVSVLVGVNHRTGAGALRAVFPVHSRRGPAEDRQRWADSVGWFITNSVLECDSTDPLECDAAVSDAISLGAHPLEPLLRPWGGMPRTPGMFALSWLDNRRLPVQVPAAAHPQHVSAWIRTDGVMAWFVLNDDGMRLRVRYPQTPEACQAVGTWSRLVTEGLRRLAGVEGAEAVAGMTEDAGNTATVGVIS
ncbi:hypothetical protein [uncultured Corynebacterium sp.]|uniref:hypothetical protein n=1 Tax=uncultured Corynebacterium sp. TaxID=159447 RepID=UPI0025EBA016|nr:hypothetical protein [uncultured Corynebacterium sp.]